MNENLVCEPHEEDAREQVQRHRNSFVLSLYLESKYASSVKQPLLALYLSLFLFSHLYNGRLSLMMMLNRCDDVVVRGVNDQKGNGLFLRSSARREAGDIVLREAPVVFAQSYATSAFSLPSRTHDTGLDKSHEDVANSDDACLTLRCCFGCGTPLVTSLATELRRVRAVQRRLQSVSPPEAEVPPAQLDVDAFTTMVAGTAGWPTRRHLLFHSENGESCVACFCSSSCETRALDDDGKRFVLVSSCHEDEDDEDKDAENSAEDVGVSSPHLFPSLAFVWQQAASSPSSLWDGLTSVAAWRALWPTRQSALNTLHHIAVHYNERLWLIVLLLAKVLAQTDHAVRDATTRPTRVDETEEGVDAGWSLVRVSAFRASLEALIDRYAEGASRGLRVEQRALLRFSWHVVAWWLYLCLNEHRVPQRTRKCDDEDEGGGEAEEEEEENTVWCALQTEGFPLQRLLQLHWLTDANVHAYVVLSPLFTWWSQAQVQVPETSSTSTACVDTVAHHSFQQSVKNLFDSNDSRDDRYTSSAAASSSSARTSGPLSAQEAAPHATGAALYDVATKINHSCDPSVRFVPNHGPVCADVVALTSLSPGEELFTSYINVDAFGKSAASAREAAAARRAFLLRGYGFLCECSLCRQEDPDPL